MYCVVNINIY